MALASSGNAHANFNVLAEQYTILCADSKQRSGDAVKGILHPQACAHSEYVCPGHTALHTGVSSNKSLSVKSASKQSKGFTVTLCITLSQVLLLQHGHLLQDDRCMASNRKRTPQTSVNHDKPECAQYHQIVMPYTVSIMLYICYTLP